MTIPTDRRILVIEDDPHHRETLTELLRRTGQEVAAHDGRAGFKQLERNSFHLLVCSLRLKRTDPMLAIRTARHLGISALAVAPSYTQFEAREACTLGADSVWALPVDSDHFLARAILLLLIDAARFEKSDERTVLLIEDNDGTRASMRRWLETAGYRTLEAPDAPLGIQYASSRPVDLILLDVMMPGLDGLTACQILKAQPETSSIPVVICTVRGSDDDQLKGMSVAADDYLIKPFRPEDLLARVDRLIRKRESRPSAS